MWLGNNQERRQRMGTVPRYQPLRMVTQVVEDMLHELTIEDIDEQLSRPAGLA
jgi:hypothetical protein